MNGKLVQNLSANTVQLVVNQAFGLVIFFILSTGLSKVVFGELNFALAVLLAVFNILSFGLDQLVIQKIAAGAEPGKLLAAYLFHTLLSGSIFYVLLVVLNYSFPQLFDAYKLLLFIGAGKLLMFFSAPFKQVVTGFERFKLLSYMSVISNIVRGLALAVLAICYHITPGWLVIIFVSGDALELLVAMLLFKRNLQIPIKVNANLNTYFLLLKEALPQIGTVIFTSALARFDWICIGLMASAVKLAEYSFAYKVFEISTLPLLALAPLLLPRFTRIVKSDNPNLTGIRELLKAEMMVACLIALVLYLCWSPVVDWVTYNKYGQVNANTVLILCLCTPLLYLNNFLWSICFAQGRLKVIFGVIAATFAVNAIGDLLLIPLFNNEGAAIAYLLAMLVQCVMYLNKNHVVELAKAWFPMLACIVCALAGGYVARLLFDNAWLVPTCAVCIYTFGLFATRQLRVGDYKTITALFSR